MIWTFMWLTGIFPKAISMAAYGIQVLRNSICAVLPVLTYLVLFVFCFSVHHSSVISRRHIESSPAISAVLNIFKTVVTKLFFKIGGRKNKFSNDKNLMQVVFKEYNCCKWVKKERQKLWFSWFCLNKWAADVLLMRTKHMLGKWYLFNLVVGQRGWEREIFWVLD